MAKTKYQVCSCCTIEETLVALAEQPVELALREIMKMWTATYAEELKTVAALFHATTETAQRYQDEQKPTKKRPAKLKAAA